MGYLSLKILAWKRLREFQTPAGNLSRIRISSNDARSAILAADLFRRMLCLERKRAERSRGFFLLMLVDAGSVYPMNGSKDALQRAAGVLPSVTRETDISGWYEEGSVLGVIFTEVSGVDRNSIVTAMRARMVTALRGRLNPEQINHIRFSFHFFPEDRDEQGPGRASDSALYPDLFQQQDMRRFSHWMKRAMDILGSFGALIVLSPLFVAISLAIKLNSRGPILFRQTRLGQHGVPFTFLKFRSMETANDPGIHREYVKRFISGELDSRQVQGCQTIYKIQEDPRVTRVGRFLRKHSLDELPQFMNVLRGEMSLVGPRPAIPYELENYDLWHRRRLLDVKPGITGLWQVNGRSRVKFDDMVRLDLRYASNWSLWLDIKILLQTPRAVIAGEGAY